MRDGNGQARPSTFLGAYSLRTSSGDPVPCPSSGAERMEHSSLAELQKAGSSPTSWSYCDTQSPRLYSCELPLKLGGAEHQHCSDDCKSSKREDIGTILAHIAANSASISGIWANVVRATLTNAKICQQGRVQPIGYNASCNLGFPQTFGRQAAYRDVDEDKAPTFLWGRLALGSLKLAISGNAETKKRKVIEPDCRTGEPAEFEGQSRSEEGLR